MNEQQAQARRERTDKIIDSFRGLKDEWGMLKGVLCADHTLEGEDRRTWDQLIDGVRVAERMDEIQNEARAKALAEFAAA
jgi:hypothetical protein